MENFNAGEALYLNKSRAEFDEAAFNEAWPEIHKHGIDHGWLGIARAAWCAALARAGSAAPAAPTAWREFIEECAMQAGGMVNGNRLSALAKKLLAAPTAAGGPTLRDADQEARYAFDVRFKNDSHVGWKPLDYWQGGYSAALARTAAPVCPSGYRLVPIVPTENMVVAFAETWFSKVRCIDDHDMTDAYAAMLDAAPLPTKEGAGEVDAVVEANRKLLLERSRVGIRKYGVTLADAGLSRAQLTQHALEEALDLANYLQTIIQTDAAIAAQPKDTTDTKEKGDA